MTRLLTTTAASLILASAAWTGSASAQACGESPVDFNADGIVDADERQAFQMGVYNGVDLNADGVVSRQEHCATIAGLTTIEPAAGPTATPEGDAAVPDALRRNWNHFLGSFDGNDNGTVSWEEFTGLTQPGDSRAELGTQTSMFRDMDENQDNHVSFEEYASHYGAAYQ